MKLFLLISIISFINIYSAMAKFLPIVSISEAPLQGVAPQVIMDTKGIIHLSIFVKEEGLKTSNTGNLYYLKRHWKNKSWSNPIRINHIKNSVRYSSIVSHHQMAIDSRGVPHITWFLMKSGKYFYNSLNKNQKKFTKERSMVSSFVEGHEAGATIAIDKSDKIYFFFAAGSFDHEDKRQIFYRHSSNYGKNFSKEFPFSSKLYGSCACCSIDAALDENNQPAVLYRSAQKLINRDMRLSFGENSKRTNQLIHVWKKNACPVSTNQLNYKLSLAVETEGKIYFSRDPKGPLKQVKNHHSLRNKNPSLATNYLKQLLVVWAQGNGWSKGGKLRWQLFDSKDKTHKNNPKEHVLEIKKYSRAAAISLPNNNFMIFY